MGKKLGWIWFILLTVLLAYFYLEMGGLPDRLAVHFDINGNPNGFQTKSAFVGTFPLFVLLINAIMAVLCLALKKIPIRFINAPWKNYWSSTTERMIRLNGRMLSLMGWVGLFVNIVFLFAVHAIVQANSQETRFYIPFNAGVFGILVLSFFFLGALFLLFRPPGD